MKRLYAIIAVISAIAVAVIALAVMTFGTAVAGERPQGRMQTCTAQWRESGADRSGYKAFIRQCLNATPAARPVAKTSAHPGNRMKICGAKWRQAKASNATHGQTWRQFSTACLKGA
ncbi:hypothetical protein [Asticcacaulis solisilvae]|uniref:hypothetical protein n=1 Tax=Asticcacaulis solisilvae TaxID=1217274 RepID=UPI003FD6F4B9